MNWLNLFQTQHAKAFSVASSCSDQAINALHQTLNLALQAGDDFGEFQRRLSQTLARIDWTQPTPAIDG